MKTIIIEDEPLVAKDLQKILKVVAPDVEILQVLDSLKACVKYFKSEPEPELLFMDVQLSDGVSFDLFNEVNLKCPIIFTTAYDEYAIRAFKLNSIDYLLKPIDKVELKAALEKFKTMAIPGQFDFGMQVQTLLAQLGVGKTPDYKEKFIVHSGKSFIIVNQHNVGYFVKDNLIYLVTKDNQKFVTDFQTMEEIEELIDPAKFYRANRQLIIQSDYVEGFKSDLYGKLIAKMKSPLNLTVDISREKATTFKKWLQNS